jgi:hypothetical protein
MMHVAVTEATIFFLHSEEIYKEAIREVKEEIWVRNQAVGT